MNESGLDFNWKIRGFNKDQFFDRSIIDSQLLKKEKYKLWKIGAYLRTRTRSILRRRKRVSAPGQPPSVRSQNTFSTLKNILYYYDPKRRSVIVGPRLLNGTVPKKSSAVSVPQLLELGGTQEIEEYLAPDGEWSLGVTDGRRRAFETQKRTARYQPRPFMGPALQAEIRAGTLVGIYVN